MAAIVCGTDFSEQSMAAVTVAAVFARRFGVPIRLLHVREPLTWRAQLDPEVTTRQAALQQQLRLEAERLRSRGVTVDADVIPGVPDEELIACAARDRARLIVVAALGRRSRDRWLLGSVADRVAQTTEVPVVVVRDAAGFEAWERGERPLRITVGADFSATSQAALRWVGELRGLGACQVTVAHVYWPPGIDHRLGTATARGDVDARQQVERILTRELAAMVDTLPGEGPVELRIGATVLAPTADLLIDMAAEAQADVLVVGTHQRSGISRLWLEAVSRRVLHAAATTVACVPAPAGAVEPSTQIPRFESVLVPTDLTPRGNRAIGHAYATVGRGGTVHLLHVVQAVTPTGALEDRAVKRGEQVERLRALVPDEAAVRGIVTHVQVVESREVADAIVQMAERLGASIVCMASHGRSGLSKALLGSVTGSVLGRCRRPVLVVPAALEA